MTRTNITQGTWMTMDPYLFLSRVLSGTVGMVLLVAGLMKATDMALFVRQLEGYGIISQPILLNMAAWGLIILQTALGVGLILYYRPRILLPVTTGLWLILLGGTLYAWLTGITGDCGCYGAWMKHSPKFATMENLALLVATLSAWRIAPRMFMSEKRAKTRAFAVALIAGIILPPIFGFAPWDTRNLHEGSTGVELGHVEVRGVEKVDLGRGSHLIVLMGTDCSHCREVLPLLDELAEEKGLPSLIALCPDDEMKRSGFIEAFDPVFPIGRIGERNFWRLVGRADMPILLLLRDGQVQKSWVHKVPGAQEIRATLSQSSANQDFMGINKYFTFS